MDAGEPVLTKSFEERVQDTIDDLPQGGRGGEGPRTKIRMDKLALVAEHPEVLKQELMVPERVRNFIEALDAMIAKRERTGMNIYASAVGLVGAAPQLNVEIVNQIGVPMEQARQAVEIQKEVEVQDVHQVASKATKFLRWYAGTHPEEFSRLGLAVDASRASSNGGEP
jgi:hypothetical protein